MINQRVKTRRGGFSLIEMLLYVAIVASAGSFLVGSVLSMAKSFALIGLTDDLNESAVLALDRIAREVADAESISGASTFGDPGDLTVVAEGGIVTRRFYVSGDRLWLEEGGSASPLTRSRTAVDGFAVDRLTAAHSDGVRIRLTMTGTRGSVSRTESYQTAVLLPTF